MQKTLRCQLWLNNILLIKYIFMFLLPLASWFVCLSLLSKQGSVPIFVKNLLFLLKFVASKARYINASINDQIQNLRPKLTFLPYCFWRLLHVIIMLKSNKRTLNLLSYLQICFQPRSFKGCRNNVKWTQLSPKPCILIRALSLVEFPACRQAP